MTTPGYVPQSGSTNGQPFAPSNGIPQQGYGPPPQGFGSPQQPYGPPSPPYGPPPYGFSQPPAPAGRGGRGKIIAAVVGGVVVLLVALGLLFGRSSGMNVESALTSALQARPGITSVSGVTCPKHVDTSAGSTTVCQATINGQPSNLTLSFDQDDHFVVTDAEPAN